MFELKQTCDFEGGLHREKSRVCLGTLGTLFFFGSEKKTEFFWGLKKLVILGGAPVKKTTLYDKGGLFRSFLCPSKTLDLNCA